MTNIKNLDRVIKTIMKPSYNLLLKVSIGLGKKTKSGSRVPFGYSFTFDNYALKKKLSKYE